MPRPAADTAGGPDEPPRLRGTRLTNAADHLIVVQYNLENGGLSDPEPGRVWDRSRLDGFIEFVRTQVSGHGVRVVLQQEGCFYHVDGSALLHEIEAATGLRGFLARGLRAATDGVKEHPTVVWIDPHTITPLRHVAHSGGTWWHSAMEVRLSVGGRPLTVVSAHLNVASPALRAGEGAALTMIGGQVVIGVDANSARATGDAQSMDMESQVYRAHRAVSPDRPDEADRAFGRYAQFAGLVEVHTAVGTVEALRWTTGHRPGQAQRDGGSHADHAYVSAALADGRAGRIADCVVITHEEYPGIEELSDHLPTRFALTLASES
jgi:hypothetical protein